MNHIEWDKEKIRLLYGTSNPSKLMFMKEIVKELNIEVIGLKDLNLEVDSIDESGNNPLENARIKALAYYEAYKKPVFSCDSGLYIEGIEEYRQPGVHVRRVNGKTLNDEEMIEYYSALAKELGGEMRVKYKNAICLVMDKENIFCYDGEDIGSEEFIIGSKPHKNRDKGFPLNSLSIHIDSGKYYMDIKENDYALNKSCKEKSMLQDNGFRKFFKSSILKYYN